MWKHAGISKDCLSILDDNITKYNRKCTSIGSAQPQVDDFPDGSISLSDGIIMWGLRVWRMTYKQECVPHVGKKIILGAPQVGRIV